GRYARVENPEVGEHRSITIGRACWLDSPEGREAIGTPSWSAPPGAGRVLIHGEEWSDGLPYQQYKLFLQDAGPEFLFRAEGHGDIRGRLSGYYVTHESRGIREFEIVIPRSEYDAMVPGVEYVLTPRNEVKGYAWKTKGRITIERPR